MKTLQNLLVAGLFLVYGSLSAQDYTANIESSALQWTGKKVAGEHSGNISLKSGVFSVNKSKISSGEFVIDMTTITNTDLEGEWNTKLVGHLNSEDFFNTAVHPTAKIVLKESSKFTNDQANVKGELTIKGITHPVSFDVKQNGKTFTTTVTVDRTLYDIKYGSGKFFDNLGDNMIDDNFILDVKIIVN